MENTSTLGILENFLAVQGEQNVQVTIIRLLSGHFGSYTYIESQKTFETCTKRSTAHTSLVQLLTCLWLLHED